MSLNHKSEVDYPYNQRPHFSELIDPKVPGDIKNWKFYSFRGTLMPYAITPITVRRNQCATM